MTADTNFLDHFTYRVIYGDRATMFAAPLNVVLTQSKARAYFGDIDPVGKTLEVMSPFQVTATVTGVVEDLHEGNTHYPFHLLVSDITLANNQDYKNWDWDNYYVYVHLSPQADLKSLQAKADILAREQYGEDTESYWNLHPVEDIYLTSDFNYEASTLGSQKVIDFMKVISIFILAIAWINYINLSTARATDRAKEVGLRKTVGAERSQLIAQFLFESFLLNLCGAVLALVFAQLVVPFFNDLVGKEILTFIWTDLSLAWIVAFIISGTILAGFYPAMILSGFHPIVVLRGKFKNSKRGIILRKGLVIFQFVASLGLITGTGIIFTQLQYMRNADLGMAKDAMITTTVPPSSAETREQYEQFLVKYNSFKETLRTHASILAVGATSNVPGGVDADINATTSSMTLIGKSDPVSGTTYGQYNDDNFLDAAGIGLIAGRNFDNSLSSDSNAIVVNRAFLKKFDIPRVEEVVDMKLRMGGGEDADVYVIRGVVQDFNRTSLKKQIEPTIYFKSRGTRNVVVRIQPRQFDEALAYLQKTWNDFYPNHPFIHTTIDQRFASLYQKERQFRDVFASFSIFAIFVALLGLFGLSSFLSKQRSLEMSIRKVFGASISNIINLFYKDFFILILIAAVIAVPLIFVGMNNWLDNYAYRIDFPWLLALVSLFLLCLMAFVTVGYQVFKVASTNPAKIMRQE